MTRGFLHVRHDPSPWQSSHQMLKSACCLGRSSRVWLLLTTLSGKQVEWGGVPSASFTIQGLYFHDSLFHHWNLAQRKPILSLLAKPCIFFFFFLFLKSPVLTSFQDLLYLWGAVGHIDCITLWVILHWKSSDSLILEDDSICWASLVAQMLKNLAAMWETWVQPLGQGDPLEKRMATHSSILAWRIPWTEVIIFGVENSWTWLSD